MSRSARPTKTRRSTTERPDYGFLDRLGAMVAEHDRVSSFADALYFVRREAGVLTEPIEYGPKGAVLSSDGTYRYLLSRCWRPAGEATRWCTFVGLNPSTADATRDDQTIRRCVDYATRWGFDGLLMVNLYAWRTVSPAVLWRAAAAGHDIVGPLADAHVTHAARVSARVVVAWGAHGARDAASVARCRVVHALVAAHREPVSLAVTADGMPGHPSRLPKDLVPHPYACPPAPRATVPVPAPAPLPSQWVLDLPDIFSRVGHDEGGGDDP